MKSERSDIRRVGTAYTKSLTDDFFLDVDREDERIFMGETSNPPHKRIHPSVDVFWLEVGKVGEASHPSLDCYSYRIVGLSPMLE